MRAFTLADLFFIIGGGDMNDGKKMWTVWKGDDQRVRRE
ncbi:hypothetical protein TPSea814_000361a [Treponema pallidum subsp. pallidum str. Sea 81-4]|nr:conserved hypothetical protein [Treponema pallidum subsp. pallidum str. Chicago]AHN67045.1 hypothetical protein TPSea814_000361a [Treponema pallidum subsp. pallidum str. Sea 81-4]